jgi:DNA-binding transcriptional ArsR family regulator
MSEETAAAANPAADADPEAPLELRQLTDPRDMRALAHPIRLALLEVLTVYGPLTATQAGELIGESPSSCSFHLRTLARHHFVEETGDGRGRQRPWRLVSVGMSIPSIPADSDTFVAAEAVAQIAAERNLARLRQWWSRRRRAGQAWIDASGQTDFATWLTPAELAEINDEVFAVLSRYHDRLTDPSRRPTGAELVELLYFSFPTSYGKLPDEPAQSTPQSTESG